ncbi:MAG: hypothetical protein FWC32_06690 [Firmicutes bacterium]|nr:hypothetical protein [Bacillota bacterium]
MACSKETNNFVKWLFGNDPNYDMDVRGSNLFKVGATDDLTKFRFEFIPLEKGKADLTHNKLTGRIMFSQQCDATACSVGLIMDVDSTGTKNREYKGFSVISNHVIDGSSNRRPLCWIFLFSKRKDFSERKDFGEFLIVNLDISKRRDIYICHALTMDSQLFNPHMYKFLMFRDTAETFISAKDKDFSAYIHLNPRNIILKKKYTRDILIALKDNAGIGNPEKSTYDSGIRSSIKVGVTEPENYFKFGEPDKGSKKYFGIVERRKRYVKLEIVEPKIIGFKGEDRDSQLFALLLSWLRGQEEVDDRENKYVHRGISHRNTFIDDGRNDEINFLLEDYKKMRLCVCSRRKRINVHCMRSRKLNLHYQRKWKLILRYRQRQIHALKSFLKHSSNSNTDSKKIQRAVIDRECYKLYPKENHVLLDFFQHHFGEMPFYKYSFNESPILFPKGADKVTFFIANLNMVEDETEIQRGILTFTKGYDGVCHAMLKLDRSTQGYSIESKGFVIVTNPGSAEKTDCWVFLKTEKTLSNDMKIIYDVDDKKTAPINSTIQCLSFSLYPTDAGNSPQFSARVAESMTIRAKDGFPIMYRLLLSKEKISDKNIFTYFYPFIRMMPSEIYIERRFYADIIKYLENCIATAKNPNAVQIHNNPGSKSVYRNIEEHFLKARGSKLSPEDAAILLEMLNPSSDTPLGFKCADSNPENDPREGEVYTEIKFDPPGKFDPTNDEHKEVIKILLWLRGMDPGKKQQRAISAIRSHTPKQRHIDVENLYRWVNEDE